MNTLLVDVSHHSMRLVSICKREETAEEGYTLWRYYFINGIINFIEQFKADEVVLAIDSKHNWRKKVFPWYKGHRKLLREKIDAKATDEETKDWFMFDEYYKQLEMLISEIKTVMPFKIIEVDTAEGDDIIGVLCSNLKNNITVVANDNDFVQLLKFPNVKIYNPIQKKFMECEDPKKALLMKICRGDDGDFVPSINDKHTFKPEFIEFCINEKKLAQNQASVEVILNDDESILYNTIFAFMEKYGIKPSRITRFSEKMAAGAINNNTLQELLNENEDMKKRFVRNGKLINLTSQPEEIKKSIMDAYSGYTLPALNGLFSYFVKSGYNGLLDDMSRVTAILKTLVEEKETCFE